MSKCDQTEKKNVQTNSEFVWISDEFESQRNVQHQKLVEFRTKNVHCMVPHKHQKDTSLGWWAVNQLP
jgi:hypothetical protein